MKVRLLDINLLLALLWPSHERHELALKWFARRESLGQTLSKEQRQQRLL